MWRSVRVEDEPREGAVLVVVASMSFASVQFDVNLISRVQVEQSGVACVIVVLVSVLSDGAGTNLWDREKENKTSRTGNNSEIRNQQQSNTHNWNKRKEKIMV